MPPLPAILGHAASLFAPPLCAACRRPVGAELVCGPCLAGLPWLRGWRCPSCALPRHRRGGCPAAAASFDRAWAPLAYDGPARQLVRALKFGRALPVARLMAAQIAANLPPDLLGLPVVPVPAQPVRRRVRGFDPAGVLTAAVAERAGVTLLDVLRRRDRSPRQVGTGRGGRRARSLRVAAAAPVGGPVILVDDVHTTGATLDACARALLEAGASAVAAVTYARTL
jgi:predicted amidophosphoribosyltransferase